MNPYKNLPDNAYWKRAVSDIHYAEISDLWTLKSQITKHSKFATAGSCFAQHIGHHLEVSGANFMNMEPAPIFMTNIEEQRNWGFGVYTCRYGNLYTSRQLLQLFDEAFGFRKVLDRVWERGGRFFDSLRPSIDPVGQDTYEKVIELRERHLQKVKQMFETLDVFVFTMGLTEGWVHNCDGTVYPTAPGTIAGQYDPEKYSFTNFRYPEIYSDMSEFWKKLKGINSTAKMILTVSPVPLIATASGDHVLSANTYSKSVLRSVAGDLAFDFPDVTYFPSYEIISSAPSRGMFFNPDLRTVNDFGVKFVMGHFFRDSLANVFASVESKSADDFDVLCDEDNMLKDV